MLKFRIKKAQHTLTKSIKRKGKTRRLKMAGEDGVWWVDENPGGTGDCDPVFTEFTDPNFETNNCLLPAEDCNILAVYEDGSQLYELSILQVDLVEYDPGTGTITETIVPDIITYDASPQDQNLNVNMDAEQSGEPVFDNFEQYYDDTDTPQYDFSGCDSSIGIRG